MNRTIPSLAILLFCGSACVAEVESEYDENIDFVALDDANATLAAPPEPPESQRGESTVTQDEDGPEGLEFDSVTLFETVEEPDPQPWIEHPSDDDPRNDD